MKSKIFIVVIRLFIIEIIGVAHHLVLRYGLVGPSRWLRRWRWFIWRLWKGISNG
jgi:hypothetical protein